MLCVYADGLWVQCNGNGGETLSVAAGLVAPPSSSGRSDTDLEEQTLRMTSGKKVGSTCITLQLRYL